MTLPYSDALFVLAFPRECTEAFLEGHVRAFAFFGGVPAADQLRQLQDRRRQDHRQPRAEAHRRVPPAQEPLPVRGPLLPGAAAQREGARRDARRLRPPQLPRARSPCVHGGLEELNARLEADCRADLARRLRGKPATKAELLAEERAALLPLPAEAFEAARVEQRRRRLAVAGPLRHQRLLGADRVRPPPGHGRRRRSTTSGSSSATAWWPTTAGAGAASGSPSTRSTTWPCWSASRGRSTSPRPLEGWELPVCFGVLRRRLEAEFGGPGTRQFIKVLRLLERASLRGADPGRRAGLGAGRGRRRRGAADPGAPPRAAGRACSASTAGRT